MKLKILKLKTLGILLALQPLSSHAGLSDLIQQQPPGTPAVVTASANSGDDGYGLLTQSRDDFANHLSLDDPSKLENAYFKIVEGEGDQALSVGDFDGDNVLYHLMRAVRYYQKLSQNSGNANSAIDPSNPRKSVVRVRVQNGTDPIVHFLSKADYNNSRYIPAEPLSVQQINELTHEQDPAHNPLIPIWSQEIWFDQKKTITGKFDWYDLTSSLGLALATQNWISMTSTPLEYLEKVNSGIDGEKIPDVIYHEAFHYSSDANGLFPMASEGNPVAEDYANYFGSSLNGRPEIAEISEFTSRYYKRDYSKIRDIDTTQGNSQNYNYYSFGPSMFWQIRNQLGQERADQLIWNSLQYIDGSFLHLDVPKAVSRAAHESSTLSESEITAIDSLLAAHHQSYLNLELKFNPGNTEALQEESLRGAAKKQAAQLKKIPSELAAQGITLDDETSAGINDAADALEAESLKPGFRSRVVGVLNDIGKAVKIAGEDTGKALGYVGSTAFAVGNVPMDFGTDLISSMIVGRAVLTDRDKNAGAEIAGATGGVASTYYSYVGLSALGFALTDVVTTSAFGIVFIDKEICSKADLQGDSDLDHYCLQNAKIMNSITIDSAKAGATIGEKVHSELKRIGAFFKKIFSA